MDAKELIARRVAQEMRSGWLVNLGIGLPTMVADYLPADVKLIFHGENGLIGSGPTPESGCENYDLTNAGGGCVTAIPGAAIIDSATSFGLARGGHLDATVLGGLQVNGRGQLANWMVPGKLVPGMGGAMDLATGAKCVIVAMQHIARGESKIVDECTLPLTSARRVDLIVTDMAVIKPTAEGLVLLEIAPNVTLEEVVAATAARLIISDALKVMEF